MLAKVDLVAFKEWRVANLLNKQVLCLKAVLVNQLLRLQNNSKMVEIHMLDST